MNLFKIAKSFKAGVQQNIFKDNEVLKQTLIKTYESIYGYDLDSLRKRLKKLKPMRTVILN